MLKIIRVPYFVQLSSDVIKQLFGIDIDYKQIFPHGFIVDKNEVLPDRPTFALEMGSTMSWYKYADYVFGIDEFGSSMPISEIYGRYGFTIEQVYETFKTKFLKK